MNDGITKVKRYVTCKETNLLHVFKDVKYGEHLLAVEYVKSVKLPQGGN